MGAGTTNTAMTDKSGRWLPGGRGRIDEAMKARRREEIAAFVREVEGDEAAFIPSSWRALLADWGKSEKPKVRAHGKTLSSATRREIPDGGSVAPASMSRRRAAGRRALEGTPRAVAAEEELAPSVAICLHLWNENFCARFSFH